MFDLGKKETEKKKRFQHKSWDSCNSHSTKRIACVLFPNDLANRNKKHFKNKSHEIRERNRPSQKWTFNFSEISKANATITSDNDKPKLTRRSEHENESKTKRAYSNEYFTCDSHAMALVMMIASDGNVGWYAIWMLQHKYVCSFLSIRNECLAFERNAMIDSAAIEVSNVFT